MKNFRKKYTSGPRYWNVPVLVNTGTLLVYQYYPKMWYLHFSEHSSVIQKLTILEHKNGLVLSNTRVPVSGTWSILFPNFQMFIYFELEKALEQTLTVIKLKRHFNYTHFCMTSHFSEVMFSRTNQNIAQRVCDSETRVAQYGNPCKGSHSHLCKLGTFKKFFYCSLT